MAGTVCFGRAELRGFGRHVHLHEELGSLAERRGGVVHLPEQVDAVNRMNQVEAVDRFLRLVRLQVADEMPPELLIGSCTDLL